MTTADEVTKMVISLREASSPDVVRAAAFIEQLAGELAGLEADLAGQRAESDRLRRQLFEQFAELEIMTDRCGKLTKEPTR